jgi:hypothetical protein
MYVALCRDGATKRNGIRDHYRKGGAMKKLVGAGLALLFLAAVAHAGERIEGKITAIDAEKGTIDVSGVTVNAKDAKVKDLIFPSGLSHLRVGWGIEAEGKFTGPLQFAANKVGAKYFRRFEIHAKVDAVDAQAKTLSVSGITVKLLPDCKVEDENGHATTLDKLPVGRMMELEGNWTGHAEFAVYSVEVMKSDEK